MEVYIGWCWITGLIMWMTYIHFYKEHFFVCKSYILQMLFLKAFVCFVFVMLPLNASFMSVNLLLASTALCVPCMCWCFPCVDVFLLSWCFACCRSICCLLIRVFFMQNRGLWSLFKVIIFILIQIVLWIITTKFPSKGLVVCMVTVILLQNHVICALT